MSLLKKHYLLLILLVLALLTRFLFLWYPSEVVFDEVHFGKFVSAYFTHQYYFDIHPPLGKLLIAGFAKLNNVKPDVSFEKIGQSVGRHELFLLRFLPALFGTLLVALFYLIVFTLSASRKAAFLAGWLVVFDNAFLVESKFILVDSFLFFFGFLSIWLFLLARKQIWPGQRTLFLVLAGLAAGLSFSIKWTGLAFWGIAIAIILSDFLKEFFSQSQFRLGILLHSSIPRLIGKLLLFLIVPFLVYVLPFAIHFQILTNSGPGDAFMSQDFQKTLVGNTVGAETQPLPFWSKFLELNQKMSFYNSTLTKEHQDGSRFFEWPFDRKPVWYWNKNDQGSAGNIYLWGNPLVWLAAFLSLGLGFLSLFWQKEQRGALFFLLFAYLANLLPFIFISRVAFLYHYLPALGFSLVLLAVLSSSFWLKRHFLYLIFLLAVFLVFVALSPISYGFLTNTKTAAIYQLLIKFFH